MAQKPGFEQRLDRLKEIVDELERGDLPLEDGVDLYKEGMSLAKACSKQLDQARNEVRLVSRELLEDFELDEGEDDDG